MILRFLSRGIAAGLLLFLSACSTGNSAIVQTMQAAWGGGDPSRESLNPNYEYLRVVADGRVAVLALGDVEGREGDPIEVWYSAQKEVIRFKNGRLVAATGLTTEWRSVSAPVFPSWDELIHIGQFNWIRTRDVMPGYQYGIRDQLLLRGIATPENSQLQNLSPGALKWFEEVMLATKGSAKLPTARYAVQRREGKEAMVVYGEQCLDSRLCFSWQRWPVKMEAK